MSKRRRGSVNIQEPLLGLQNVYSPMHMGTRKEGALFQRRTSSFIEDMAALIPHVDNATTFHITSLPLPKFRHLMNDSLSKAEKK